MTSPYMSFGEYLSHFMEARGLSGVALARILGEKSATVIVRMKADQCSHSRCEAFLEQLICHLDLTDDELYSFRRSLAVNRLGREAYSAFRAIHEMFTSVPQPNLPHGNLRELLAPPENADHYDVICMQCSNPVVSAELTGLCLSTSTSLNIRHYITFPLQSTTAQFAVSLLPILCDSRYRLTELRFPHGNPQLGISAQSFIFTRSVCAGKETYTLLLPDENGNALSLSIASEDSYKNCEDFIAELDCERIPINPQYVLDSAHNVVSFLDNLRMHEQGRGICIFKRDFCFSFLPVDIIQSAFNDMLSQLPPEFGDVVTELRRLFFMRHRAVCETTHPIRMLVSRQGMQNFMRTGLLSDHFFGLRPFTKAERQEIVRHVIMLTEMNPNITVYTARDDSIYGAHDLFVYEKHGVLLMHAQTDYQYAETSSEQGHIEALLPDPQLTAQMVSYFEQHLLPLFAHTQEESLQFLHALLEE